MSDLELYIYIGLVLIYFLTRVLKQKKTPRPPGDYKDSAPGDQGHDFRPKRERPMTFEELLQEFTGTKEPPQTVLPDEIKVEEHEAEMEPVAENHEYQTYEGYDDYKTSSYTNYDEVFEKGRNLTTLDEQIDLGEPIEKQFEAYESTSGAEICDRARKYRRMLMKRDSLRDAFILKEILDPKYL